MLVVLSYAAYSAVILSISAFGSSFMLALGIMDTEQDASITFGIIASAAWLIGTVL